MEALRRHLAESGRRVFFTSVRQESFCADCSGSMHATFWEAVPKGAAAQPFHVLPEANRFFEDLVDWAPHDAWERSFRNWHLHNYAIYLTAAMAEGDEAVRSALAPMLGVAERDYHSLAGLIDGALQNWLPEREGQVVRWMERLERRRPRAWLTKEQGAKFLYMKAFLRFQQGHREEAVALLRESAAAYANPRNEAAEALKKIGADSP